MKIPQITIKYSKALESSTQVILEKDYYKAKARLEKLGYKILELPIKLKFRNFGNSKMRIFHILDSLINLVKLSYKNYMK